jgi:hypothetical protein
MFIIHIINIYNIYSIFMIQLNGSILAFILVSSAIFLITYTNISKMKMFQKSFNQTDESYTPDFNLNE